MTEACPKNDQVLSSIHPFSEDLREAGMWLDTEFQSWQASRFLTRIGTKWVEEINLSKME